MMSDSNAIEEHKLGVLMKSMYFLMRFELDIGLAADLLRQSFHFPQ